MNAHKETRESKRISVLLKGNYRIWESDFPFAVMTAVNISENGLCMATDSIEEPAQLVELNIILPNDERITLFAQTVWSCQLTDTSLYRTGLEIMDRKSEDFKKFKTFYEQRLLYPPHI